VDLLKLPYAKEYQIFSYLLTRAKNLLGIQGINSFTRLSFTSITLITSLFTTFTSLHELKKTTRSFPFSFLRNYLLLLRIFSFDFFIEHVENTSKNDCKRV
jgi:hypothetical protein